MTEKLKTYDVVVVEPKKSAYQKNMSMDEIKELVGNLEPLNLYDDIYALLNADGRHMNLEVCRDVVLQDRGIRTPLFGTFVMITIDGTGDFASLNEEELKEALYVFRVASEDATVFI